MMSWVILCVVDLSDNRSGSSLNSDEKDVKRKEYLDKGIRHFNDDIQKILNAVGNQHRHGNSASVLSYNITPLILLGCSVLLRL